MPKVVIAAKPPEKIAYYDAPPALGGVRQLLSVKQFEAKMGITFTESVLVQDEQTETMLRAAALNSPSKDPAISELEQLLLQPFSGLAIAFINEQVGHGVFAERDIPAFTYLCCYSGVIAPLSQTTKSNRYCSLLRDELALDAQQYRGIGGFMQHLVTDQERDSQELCAHFRDSHNIARFMSASSNPQEIAAITQLAESARADGALTDERLLQIYKMSTSTVRKDRELESLESLVPTHDRKIPHLATSNVEQRVIYYKGTYVIAFVTNRLIRKHEIVGPSYGEKYWEYLGISPEYFSRLGEIVPRNFYRRVSNIHVTLKTQIGRVQVTNDRASFIKDVEKNTPAFVDERNGDASVYDLRQQLVAHNAASPAFGEIDLNTVGLAVKSALKEKKIAANVKLFWQTPINVDKAKSVAKVSEQTLSDHKVDVVCRADNDAAFQTLRKFLAKAPCVSHFFASTREFVLENVNDDANKDALRRWIASDEFPTPKRPICSTG